MANDHDDEGAGARDARKPLAILDTRRRTLAHGVATASSAIYLMSLIAAPLLAPERDLLRSHPEHYADTEAGWLVRLGYLTVALMAWAVAVIVWRAPSRARLVAVPLAIAGGMMALTAALAPQEVIGGPLLVGVFALALTPAAASIARRRTLPSIVVALGTAVTLAFAALAISPTDAAGLVNRIWDGLLALWAVAFGLSDRRGS